MTRRKPQGPVYFVVFYAPFGLRMPTHLPEIVHECRDPRLSAAIARLPKVMQRYGFGRYSLYAVLASGLRTPAVTLTFTDPEKEEILRSRHCCPQCQEVRKVQRTWPRERPEPVYLGRIEDLGEIRESLSPEGMAELADQIAAEKRRKN